MTGPADAGESPGRGDGAAPRLSIVIVTWNSAADLIPCLESVAAGTRHPFEVIVVDNASTDGTRAAFETFAAGRPVGRFRAVWNDSNTGYARAANQGYRLAAGDLLVFLNPDTAVTPGWDEALAAALAEGVGAVGPVSDHAAGLQFFGRYLEEGPAAAPGESAPSALAALARLAPVETRLLLGFCLMVPRAVLEAHGPLDENLVLGGDDLEYSLRLRRAGLRLLVVPAVFVHHKGQASFAAHPAEAVERFRQEGVDGVHARLVEWYGDRIPSPMDLWGINWFRPTALGAGVDEELVSIVIPVAGGLTDTLGCLESIEAHTPERHEVIVVDNGSTDGTAAALAARPGIRLLRNETNLGFAGGVNCGIRTARGGKILLLNNDTLVTPGWLSEMLLALRSGPRVGMVGAVANYVGAGQQVDVTYTDPRDAFRFGAGWRAAHAGETRKVDFLTGLCLLVRREVFDVVGLFDERFRIGNFEDNDFCLRVRLANYELLQARGAYLHHYGNRTFQALGVDYRALTRENRRLFIEKWRAVIPETLRVEGDAPPKGAPDPAKCAAPVSARSAAPAPAGPGLRDPGVPNVLPAGPGLRDPGVPASLTVPTEDDLWAAVEAEGPLVLDDAAPMAARREAALRLGRLALDAGRPDVAEEFLLAIERFDAVAAEEPPVDPAPFLQPGPELLLLGVGDGRLLIERHEAGCRVTGLEPDRERVASLLEMHPSLPVVHGMPGAMPFIDGRFERAVLGGPPGDAAPPRDLLEELLRVCRDGFLAPEAHLRASGILDVLRGPGFRVDPVTGAPGLVHIRRAEGGPRRAEPREAGSGAALDAAPGAPSAPGPAPPAAPLDPALAGVLAALAAETGGRLALAAARDETLELALAARGIETVRAAEDAAWSTADAFGQALAIGVLENRADPHLLLENLVAATAPGSRIVVLVPEGARGTVRSFWPATLHAELRQYGPEVRFHASPVPGWIIASFANEKGMDPERDFPMERSKLSAAARRNLADLAPGRGAVVFAAQYFDPPRGGAEISARILMEALVAAGHECHVVQRGPETASFQRGALSVHQVWEPGRFEDLIGWLKPDLVITQLALAPAAVRAGRAAGAATAVFVRSYEPLCPAPLQLARCDRVCARCPAYAAHRAAQEEHREALRAADRVFVNSHFMRGILETLTGVEGVVASPPVVPPEAEPPRTPRYLAMVKPAPHKGVGVLLDLARALPEQEFLLVGGRPPGPLPLNVVVRDWVSPGRVLDDVRLLLVPSQWPEPFGRVVVEALARGVPVLASRTGGLPESGGDAVRYVDDYENPGAWRAALEALLDDPAELRRMSVQGPAQAAAFAPGRVLPGCLAALEELTARRGPVPAIGISPPAGRRPGALRSLAAAPAIRWEGEFTAHHSLAHVNREMVRALNRADVPISPVEMDPLKGTRTSDGDAVPPDVTIRHLWPPRLRRPASGKFVVVLPWEFGALPAGWARAMQREVDEVWVPSESVRGALLRSGVDPARVAVVPNGVDPAQFHPAAPAMDLPTARSFRFLWVGGATPRKGFDILLTAYERAFSDQDDVCLVMKDSPIYGDEVGAAVQKFRGRPRAPEILHLVTDLPPDGVPSLYAACHAFVAPYRGEGYGLPIAEAMAVGLPAIVTGYGGALQFAHEGIAFLLRPRLVPCGFDGVDGSATMGIPYLAECRIDDVAARMRTVYDDREAAWRIGARASGEIRTLHTWDLAARRAAERIAALTGGPVEPATLGQRMSA